MIEKRSIIIKKMDDDICGIYYYIKHCTCLDVRKEISKIFYIDSYNVMKAFSDYLGTL